MDNFFNTIPFSQAILLLLLGALLHFILRVIDIYIIPLEKRKRAITHKLWQRFQILLWFFFALFFYATLFWKNPNLTIVISIIILGLGWQYWSNVFSGIMIKYNNRLKAGDIIKTDFTSGKLKSIKLAYSELINNNGELVVIPNQKLKKSVLKHQQVKSVIETHIFTVNPKLADNYNAVKQLAVNCPYLSANQQFKINKTKKGEYRVEGTLIDYSFFEKVENYFNTSR